jgi:hypothetical protein
MVDRTNPHPEPMPPRRPVTESPVNTESPDVQRVAILDCTVEALESILQLPAGSHIDGIYAPLDVPGTLQLRIRGPLLPPVRIGAVIPHLRGLVDTARYPDGMIAYKVRWESKP